MRKLLSTILALTLIFVASLTAQSKNGKAVGAVRDTAKNPIPGVTVRFTNRENRLVFTRISDESGRFQLELLAGRYDVSVELRGFQTVRLLDVVVKADETLEVPAVSLEITGSRGYPLIPPEAATPGAGANGPVMPAPEDTNPRFIPLR